MRALRQNPAIAIAALLALLLLVYVSAGGRRDRQTSQTRCTTRGAYDQINAELFRRAAALRPDNQAALEQVAGYSVVRRNSQVQRRSEKSGAVHCSGAIALDLPPGIAASGGQHSLTANVAYALAPAAGGQVELRSLSKVDPIVRQLAEIVEGPGKAQPPAPAEPDAAATNETATEGQPPLPPPLAPQVQRREVRPAPPPAPPQRTPLPRPVAKAVPPSAPKQVPAVPKKAAPSAEANTPAPPPSRPAIASPSFNCRFARTRGEIAVCRDPGLASLDRQMANQFSRALSRASPGAKLILQRSRTRFLKYRDSCSSDACIADAYRGRMNEIEDISSRY